MTLKEYMDFVIALNEYLKLLGLADVGVKTLADCRQAICSLLEDLLNKTLRSMIGCKEWERFALSFHEKIGLQVRVEWLRFVGITAYQALDHQAVLWSLLAEFCESLLVRSGSGEKESQDAAEAEA